jgi:hypothetical protein
MRAIPARKHAVMLNVETDVVVAPILYKMAQAAGVLQRADASASDDLAEEAEPPVAPWGPGASRAGRFAEAREVFGGALDEDAGASTDKIKLGSRRCVICIWYDPKGRVWDRERARAELALRLPSHGRGDPRHGRARAAHFLQPVFLVVKENVDTDGGKKWIPAEQQLRLHYENIWKGDNRARN